MVVLLRRTKSLLRQCVFLAITVPAICSHGAMAQTQPKRFWLAGRYDWNRVLIYFDAVQFGDAFPTDAEKIPCPIQVGMFCPVKLVAGAIEKFQNEPSAERFALGDKFDLFVDGNSIATVTLTTLVGFQSDEGVGNDSYIGALGTIEESKQDWLYFTKTYLAARRHQTPKQQEHDRGELRMVFATLLEEPVEFAVQTKIVDLLQNRMNILVSAAKRHEVASISPSFTVQQFRLADGSLRYYARAAWNSGNGENGKSIAALGAWIAPSPMLHVLAEEPRDAAAYLPELLNVIDLRDGKTAIVVRECGNDSGSVSLVEYRDGVNLKQMRTLQEISAGE
jgi:hypothetical protein